ncbi:thioredoxin domain-containing protein [Micromonospora sp. NPDC047548]|uniref:DsbA family protein n=1 Tax=Micromonospora sp. NPDC047548 TaxID=3155624 RepID=UPI0033C6F28D
MSKEARIKVRALRQVQAVAARRRHNRMWLAGGVVIVGLLVAIVAVVVTSVSKGDSSPNSASGQLVTPANLTDTGAIPVGQATGPVTLEIYLDYMCPACGMFEQANGGEIDRLVKAGTVKVQLRPISFLDRASKGSKYSTRAANAMATVADRAPGSVWAFHRELFDRQPEEGTRGLSDDQIAELARKAGVPKDVADAFIKRAFERWVATSTDAAFKSGIQGTPTIKINGMVFQGNAYTPGPLTQAIEAAAGGAK